MSNPNLQEILQSPRAQAEYERLRAILEDRNQALHHTEEQLEQYQISEKHARRNMRAVMILALIIICALAFGGAA